MSNVTSDLIRPLMRKRENDSSMFSSSRSNTRRRLVPILAIITGVSWLVYQEAGRRQMAEQVDALRSRLSNQERMEQGDPAARSGRRSALERRPVDWEVIASSLRRESSIGGGLLDKNARLLADIEAKSLDELLAILDEVAAADLSLADRDAVEQALAAAMIKKDPRAVFSRFTVRGRSEWCNFLSDQYLAWVQRDTPAAISWLRKHVEEGGFFHNDMINYPFFNQLTSAPETSAEILACLPPELRLESLSSLAVGQIKESDQAQWAKIVRDLLPEADRLTAIAWPLGNWSDGDGSPMRLHEVDAYLGQIEVRDDEWNALVMTIAQEPGSWRTSRSDKASEIDRLERMRSWVAERAPGLLEPATLRALETMANKGQFGAASKWALEFHADGGSDDYLSRVLECATDESDPEMVRKLIEHLSDSALQEKYREMQRRRVE